MLRRLSNYFRRNVIAFLALFVALGGTGAYAANTIRSTDIVDGEVKSVDVANQDLTGGDIKDGSLTTYDLADGAGVAGADVVNNDLTGADIKNDSLTGADIDESTLAGVKDGCHAGAALLGRLCAGSDGVSRTWDDAWKFCASIGLRLPSVGEALTLAQNYDVPGIPAGHYFWTDDITGTSASSRAIVSEEAQYLPVIIGTSVTDTLCVETPTDV